LSLDFVRQPRQFNQEPYMSRAFSFQRAVLVPAIAIVCMVALPGCGSKVNDEHYNKIKTGMTEAEVKDILGAPTTTETGTGLLCLNPLFGPSRPLQTEAIFSGFFKAGSARNWRKSEG
jgi:hypothetical protein